MANEDDDSRSSPENLSTVGSGRIDELFDDVESSIEALDDYGAQVESIVRRIEANDGETSGAVRDRVNDDVDAFVDDLEDATDRLSSALRELKRTM